MSIKGMTESGFPWEIDEAALDDMELLEDLNAMDQGSVRAVLSVLTRLLGEDQKERFYEHYRGENGRVSKTAVMGALAEIFNAIKAGKKS